MSEVKRITVQIAPPRAGRYPYGLIAHGYYTLEDGVLQMTDPDGKPAGLETGREYRHKLAEGEDAKAWAVKMTKQLRLALRDRSATSTVAGFDGPLPYRKLGWM